MKNKDFVFKYINRIKFSNEEYEEFNKYFVIFFLFLYILFPIITSLIIFIINKINNSINPSELNIVNGIIQMITLFSVLILSYNNFKLFLRKGLWILLIYPIFIFITGFINLPVDQINKERINIREIFYLVLSLVIFSLLFFFYFRKNSKQEKYNLINSFKKENILVLSIIVILSTIFSSSINYGLVKLSNLWVSNSDNNDNILKYLNSNPIQVIGITFQLIIVAPIAEELIFRKSLSEIVNNKWWMIPLSTICFAFYHIQNTNQWEFILPYLPLGFINSFLYFSLKNTTPIIIVHILTNLITIVLISI
ncbi:MAG: lysostaphin resistance A-like protein [Mycoplasmoidaceae bacterium]